MILQWGSTIKVSIELPVTTRHRRDMTEKLLKATLNPNSHTHTRPSATIFPKTDTVALALWASIYWMSQFPVLGVSGMLFFFYFILFSCKQFCKRSAASDLGLHCLPRFPKWDTTRHKWVKVIPFTRLACSLTPAILTLNFDNWSLCCSFLWRRIFEPRHDKTNKVTVRRAKTQISLSIR